jgi:cytochrome o ubiquinol oxidase subunit 2
LGDGTQRAFAACGGLALTLLLGGCQMDVLDPKGPIAAQEKLILLDALGVMLVIVVPTILATLGFAWWYRAGNAKAKYRPEFTFSGRIELIVWSIPILTIAFLGGLIWIGAHELDPKKPIESKVPPLEVQVVSLDWKWLFIYPAQGIASVNQLVLPAGTPVHFSITSASVMNVFFVPQLGSQIYAMNGMVTGLNLMADRPGTFRGQSSHFSGDGFSDMEFQVKAVSPADFSAWAQGAGRAGPTLDGAAYAGLSKQSQAVQPFTYRAVQPDLFNAIATRSAPPGPGPETGRGGVSVSPRGKA